MNDTDLLKEIQSTAYDIMTGYDFIDNYKTVVDKDFLEATIQSGSDGYFDLESNHLIKSRFDDYANDALEAIISEMKSKNIPYRAEFDGLDSKVLVESDGIHSMMSGTKGFTLSDITQITEDEGINYLFELASANENRDPREWALGFDEDLKVVKIRMNKLADYVAEVKHDLFQTCIRTYHRMLRGL